MKTLLLSRGKKKKKKKKKRITINDFSWTISAFLFTLFSLGWSGRGFVWKNYGEVAHLHGPIRIQQYMNAKRLSCIVDN